MLAGSCTLGGQLCRRVARPSFGGFSQGFLYLEAVGSGPQNFVLGNHLSATDSEMQLGRSPLETLIFPGTNWGQPAVLL